MGNESTACGKWFGRFTRKNLNSKSSVHNRRARSAQKKFVPLSDADSKNRLSAIPFKENPTTLVGISIFCCDD